MILYKGDSFKMGALAYQSLEKELSYLKTMNYYFCYKQRKVTKQIIIAKFHPKIFTVFSRDLSEEI